MVWPEAVLFRVRGARDGLPADVQNCRETRNHTVLTIVRTGRDSAAGSARPAVANTAENRSTASTTAVYDPPRGIACRSPAG
jgi:hypothetical protein